MNSLEIALILIGIVIIIISCRLVDKAGKVTNQEVAGQISLVSRISEEDRMQLKDKMNELLSEVSEETIIRTDDTLSKLSNEKIMAVNEFSDQIIEKINRNHEEVVFLYSMLNDKERELKSAVKEIDTSKKKVQEIMESKMNIDKIPAAKNSKTQSSANSITQATGMAKPAKTVNQPTEASQETTISNSLSSNNNSQILALYSHGKTVMEISKLLGLGQGEVKLVIDLFKGKK